MKNAQNESHHKCVQLSRSMLSTDTLDIQHNVWATDYSYILMWN